MIETDMAGNVIVAASYFNIGNTYTAYEGDTLYTHVNLDEDIVLLKLDGSGSFVWSVIIEGTAPIVLVGFDVDQSNNSVLWLRSSQEISYQGQQFPAGYTVLKLDPNNDLLWHTSILGAETPYFKTDMISVDPYDRIVLAGNIGVSDTLTVNGSAYPPPGERNLFFCRLAPDGSLDQQYQFSFPANDSISVMALDASSGDVLIAGNTNGHYLILDGDTLSIDVDHMNNLCVLRFTDQGSLVWGRNYFGSIAHPVIGTDVVSAPGSNTAFVSGYFYETADHDGFTLTSAGNHDALLMKVDGSGTMIWAKPVGDVHTNQTSWIAASQEGSVVISGFGINNQDLMHKYQSNGGTEWILPYSGGGNMNSTNTEFNSLGELFCVGLFDDEMVIGGSSMNTPPSGGNEVFLLKFHNQDISTGVADPDPLDQLRPSPNPGRDHFYLQLPPGPHELTLFDAQGRQVLRQQLSEERPVISTATLPSGIYHIHVTDAMGWGSGMRWVKE